jgi:hypothetical protein
MTEIALVPVHGNEGDITGGVGQFQVADREKGGSVPKCR